MKRKIVARYFAALIAVVMLMSAAPLLPKSLKETIGDVGLSVTAEAAVTYYPKCASRYSSIVDALRSIGVDSSYNNRKSIAQINGIGNYTGTASQNQTLLSLLKQGKLIKSKTTTPSIALSTGNFTLDLNGTKSKVITVSHQYSKSCCYSWETSRNSNYAKMTWGAWTNNRTACPLTVQGLNKGSFLLRVHLKDWDTKTIVASTGWITVTVNNSSKPQPTSSSGGSQDIPNGWFMIISRNSDDRVLDINDWNQNNGGNLETYIKNNTSNQRFQMINLKNGYYAIKALHSGRYLHIQDERYKTSNVHQWEGYYHNNAQWALRPAGNGYYYLQNRGNGSFLDNSNGNTAPGNNVITYPYNGSAAQMWKFVSTSNGYDEKSCLSDGWYEVQSANNNSYVWDINVGTNNGMDNGANLEIHQRHGGNNQKFYIKYLNNGYYAIKAGHSNKYLHKQNAGHIDNVVQWAGYSTSSIQTQWAIAADSTGYYNVRAKAGNYVDNSNATVKNGNNVITYTRNGSNAQMWKFVKCSAPGAATPVVTYETYYVTTTSGLILRKGRGTNYDKILTMPYGSAISVESGSISGGWAKAKYNGYTGYCSTSYISKTRPFEDNKSKIKERLDQIMNGRLTYNKNTVMKLGSKFVGYRANEQCKGYAKNVFYLCFKITPSSTQPKPNNYKLYSTNGMALVSSNGSINASRAKQLFANARPGDFVQIRRTHTGSHSAIVYSVSSTGVTFVEANLDGKNTVYKRTYTWADLSSKNAGMSVYTATSYSLK